MKEKLRIVEAGLNSLIKAIKRSEIGKEIEREVFQAAQTVHYGKISTETELLNLVSRVVSISRPVLLVGDWQEAWGNLFSTLIQLVLSSEKGMETVISFLYGLDEIPSKAAGERVLCVNPGSTSTKLALFHGLSLQVEDEVHLPPEFEDGIETRAEAILEWLERQGIEKGGLTGIVCRGGFVKPVPTGTYLVNQEMVEDLREATINHASNMAIPIGMQVRERFSGEKEILITVTDPVGSDEMITGARLTGIKKLLRDGAGAHYLNQNAVHNLISSILGLDRRELTTIGAHIGGGISVVRHEDAQIGDLVNAFSGVPSANRSGNISLDILLRAFDQGEMSIPELKDYLFRKGGLIDLAGTNDFKALLHFRDTGAVDVQREKIELIIYFMISKITGAIMSLAAIKGTVDLVMLTGGLARNAEFTGRIKRRLLPYFPTVVIPGSIEHEAMMAGHLRALFKPGSLKDYCAERDNLRKHRTYEKDLIEAEIFAHPHLRRKENAPVSSLDELIYISRAMVARYRVPRIAIVGAENEEALVAAKQANEEGHYPLAKFYLVGDFYAVNKIAWEYDIKVDGDNYTIVDADDPVERAVSLLDSGEADLLMKGGVKTAEIMQGTLRYLKKSGRMRKGRVYSHVGIFQIPTYPKLLIVTDAALIPNPDQEMKKKILENALMVAEYLNIKNPKAAVISAVEVANPSVQSSMLAAELAGYYRERTDCIVEGPLSLDVAMSVHSAEEKGYPGKIQGNADILLMPNIEAGNVVYKSLTVSSGASLAGAIVGAGIPIVLTSRGDSARSKLASICFASLVAMRQGDISINEA
ncbi:MAG: butyrate kinase [Candidatus Krumholzibacteriota bacterium]|nr:butyrate kinase [Candidatus Krumholzibacteriota bacterium]